MLQQDITYKGDFICSDIFFKAQIIVLHYTLDKQAKKTLLF
jgi:hypothetical protein